MPTTPNEIVKKNFLVIFLLLSFILDDRLIINNNCGIGYFTIQNTLPTDQGAYNVVVNNKQGNDSTIVRLHVEGKHYQHITPISDKLVMLKKKKSPSIQFSFSDKISFTFGKSTE